MKDYSRIIGKITSTPWMIEEGALKMMLEIFNAHLSGQITQEEIKARMDSIRPRQSESTTFRRQSVGVLPLQGPIFPKANLMTEMSGATSLEQFRNDFRTLMADESVSSIVLDIDSPGGLSDMVDEMATEIREARGSKPIYAIANTAMNSAAYYIGSQATQLFATPSGQVGSIGTYMVHTDDSGQKEMKGIKETVIKSGRFKASTVEPLTDESHTHLQQHVNEINDEFIAAVAKGRKVSIDDVKANFGEGGIKSPKSALKSNMIDGIATLDQILADLTSGGGSQTGHVVAASSNVAPVQSGAPVLRQSYDADKEHSEPGTGTGGEPTPREPPEKGDKAIEGGWRRDPPPPAYETEEYTVNRAWLEARATALGIEFNGEVTDEDLATKVASRVDEVIVPVSAAADQAEKARQWEKDYPEQAKRLAALESNSHATQARAFAESYVRFEGESKGYSTLAREEIEKAHLAVATGQFTADGLKTLLDATSGKEAVVDWAEQGSSRETDKPETVAPGATTQEVRAQFATLVRTAMTEDSLSREAAIAHVSEQHPELAEAYLASK